jgi:hypothetical protein
MKKIIFTALVALGFIVIIATFYRKNGQFVANAYQATPTGQKPDNRVEASGKNSLTPTGQAFMVTNNVTMPAWVLQMNNINENPAFSRETKIKKLAELLDKNVNNLQAIQGILQALSQHNPVEAVDQILPYLKNPNEAIQNAALTALNNSMLLTDQEQAVKKSNAEFDRLRGKIPLAVNTLFDASDTSDNLKKAIISGYMTTNDNPEDTRKMTHTIIQQGSLNDTTAAYLASALIQRSTNTKDLITQISKLPNVEQEKIIAGLGNNILNNDNVVSVLDQQQRQALKSYILAHPPESRQNPEKADQLDAWRHTVNVL